MNKVLAIVFMTFLLIPVHYAQHSLSIGIRNTPFYSSLGKFMNEGHLINDGSTPIHDSRTYLKYGVGLDYRFNKPGKLNHTLQFTTGHRYIKETLNRIYESVYDTGGWNEETRYNQMSYSLAYLIGSGISLNRFVFNGDIGVSVQRIGKGHQDWYSSNFTVSNGEKYSTDQNMTIGGGWGFGLVSTIEIGYKLNERFSIFATINNYFSFLMFLEKDHYIGQFYAPDESLSPSSSWDYYETNRHLRMDNSRIVPAFMFRYNLK